MGSSFTSFGASGIRYPNEHVILLDGNSCILSVLDDMLACHSSDSNKMQTNKMPITLLGCFLTVGIPKNGQTISQLLRTFLYTIIRNKAVDRTRVAMETGTKSFSTQSSQVSVILGKHMPQF